MSSDSGTSAGTILGAILFIAYVRDAPKEIFPKFADDFAVSQLLMTLQILKLNCRSWSMSY